MILSCLWPGVLAYDRTPEVRGVLRRVGLFLLAWVALLARMLLR
jgi:hypothetical protein